MPLRAVQRGAWRPSVLVAALVPLVIVVVSFTLGYVLARLVI